MATADDTMPESAVEIASTNVNESPSAPVQVKMKEGSAESKSEPMETTDTTINDTTASTSTSSDAKGGEASHEQTPSNDSTKMETTSEKSNSENTSGATQSPPALNPWDHSSRRIVVSGVMKFLDGKRVKKDAEKWAADCSSKGDMKIVIDKVRKPPRDPFMIVTLMEEAMVEPFLNYFVQTEITNRKGYRIMAKRVLDKNNEHHNSNDPDSRKRKDRDGMDDDLERFGKAGVQRRHRDEIAQRARRPITKEEIYQKLTPLYQLSPDAQAKQKFTEMIRKCAVAMGKEIKMRFKQLQRGSDRKGKNDAVYAWLKKDQAIPLQKIQTVPSPLRNKVEYTFGYRYVYDDEVDAEKDATPDTQETNIKQEEGTTDATMTDADKASEPDQSTRENGSQTIKTDEAETTAESDKVETEDTRKVKKIPSAGFMVTGWSGGVCKPQGCANISSEMSAIGDLFEDFLQDSPIPVYDTKAHEGVWRMLTIRVSRRTRQCMLILTHAPLTGAEGNKWKDENVDYSKDWEKEIARLTDVLQKAELPVLSESREDLGWKLKITSLLLMKFEGLSNPGPDTPVKLVFGKPYLEEQLGQCTFQISPGAFFQVNTPGAELLYGIVMDQLRDYNPKTEDGKEKKKVLFDVCCGTGTIGLACLKEGVVDRVVGVDISEPAIEDAKRNAKLNGFEDTPENPEAQTRFVASRAEHVMSKEIQLAKKYARERGGGKDSHAFIAVVDPARDGLHTEVIRALRSTERIQRVVYVSCNPTGSMVKDAGLLCSPATKRYGGTPFKPTIGYPVDMFPLTNHCEMVMTFDRVTEEDISGEATTKSDAK